MQSNDMKSVLTKLTPVSVETIESVNVTCATGVNERKRYRKGGYKVVQEIVLREISVPHYIADRSQVGIILHVIVNLC